jgi:hypothetical protein
MRAQLAIQKEWKKKIKVCDGTPSSAAGGHGLFTNHEHGTARGTRSPR